MIQVAAEKSSQSWATARAIACRSTCSGTRKGVRTKPAWRDGILVGARQWHSFAVPLTGCTQPAVRTRGILPFCDGIARSNAGARLSEVGTVFHFRREGTALLVPRRNECSVGTSKALPTVPPCWNLSLFNAKGNADRRGKLLEKGTSARVRTAGPGGPDSGTAFRCH